MRRYLREGGWHIGSSYGPTTPGPDGCMWCNRDCTATDQCPCCRSRWIRIKRAGWYVRTWPRRIASRQAADELARMREEWGL